MPQDDDFVMTWLIAPPYEEQFGKISINKPFSNVRILHIATSVEWLRRMSIDVIE